MPKMNTAFPVLSVPTTDGMPANVMMMDAASIAGGMAFLVGELEKRDERHDLTANFYALTLWEFESDMISEPPEVTINN